MKVVFVIGSLGRGGSERQIVEFVRHAHPRLANCVVVCLGTAGELAHLVEAVGARVVPLEIRGLKRNPVSSLMRLGKLLREFRPDFVYGFLFHGSALGFVTAALFCRSATRVLGCRSDPAFDGCPRPFRPLRGVVNGLADGLIVNSEAMRKAWCLDSPRLCSRIHTVPNGVRVPADRIDEAKPDRTCVICVANLIAYKGHVTLLDACADIARHHRNWSLILVGDGPERGDLEKRVQRTGLDDIVSFVGQRDDVDVLLARAQIAVLASYTEGMPNAVLEAMAHGLPVVATDVGGVRELLGTGAGLVVPPRDSRSMATALQTMLTDQELRRRAGERGRSLARANFGIPLMAERTLDAFRQMALSQ